MLELAIERGWVDIAWLLLEAGADPNYRSRSGEYSVMGAAKRFGDARLLAMLVEAGGADDGSPLLHEPIERTRQEKLYGRGGNLTANLLEHLHHRLFKSRKRRYEAAAWTLADRDCFKLVDKVLELLECPSMSEFVLHHERYVANAVALSAEDREYILNAWFSFSDDCHPRPMDINDQLCFVKLALRFGTDGRGTLPEPDPAAQPVLDAFARAEYGEDYIPGETQALAHMRQRLYEKYLKLFPERDLTVRAEGWLDSYSEDEAHYDREFSKLLRMNPSFDRLSLRMYPGDIGTDGNGTIW